MVTYKIYGQDGSLIGEIQGKVWKEQLEKTGMFCLVNEAGHVACAYAAGYWGYVEIIQEPAKVDKPVKRT